MNSPKRVIAATALPARPCKRKMTSLNWIPREVERAAEPQLVKKHQRRFTSMDDKILFLYAQGMMTREIVTTFKEMYGADVSATPISKVTDAVIEQIDEWQSYPLDAIQPIVYLDCIVVKIRQDKKVLNKAIYLALGVNLEGHKELSGLWLSGNEGAKFWLNLLTELQNRGVKNILIACVDGLKGFPDAINTALYCAYATELDEVGALERLQACAADLKKIYQSITGEEALPALDKFSDRWDNKHPGQPLLECLLAKSQHAVLLPGGQTKSDLHDQRH